MRRFAALWRILAFSDRGQSLVEVTVAMMVLSVAVLGVVGTMGLGVSLTGGSRQRSSASSVATERLERARNVPFSRVATYQQPTHVNDPKSPDYNVTTDNTHYKVDGNSSMTEELVVDSVSGAFKHIDDPTTVGVTQFSVYQYVTWVADGAEPHAYKRVTVIVAWKHPVASTTKNSLTQSTFLTDGTVTVPGAAAPPAPPAPPAEPPPAPGPCEGDNIAPSGGSIIAPGTGGQVGFTNQTSVTLQLRVTDSCQSVIAELSANDSFTPTFSTVTLAPDPVDPAIHTATPTFQVSTGDGPKTIYVRFKDGAGNPSASPPASTVVTLDTRAPTTPGKLTESCSFAQTKRSTTLSWGASSDTPPANMSGYRIYIRVNSSAWTQHATTSSLTYSDSPPGTKLSDAIEYKVRAYDKAGNESGDTNVVSSPAQGC